MLRFAPPSPRPAKGGQATADKPCRTLALRLTQHDVEGMMGEEPAQEVALIASAVNYYLLP